MSVLQQLSLNSNNLQGEIPKEIGNLKSTTKTTKYHPPPSHKEKKTVRSKSTHNPLGDIAIHERWSTVEEALFAKLCIESSLKEEVNLAAYLACWLCVFVPSKDVNSVRPITFKMASLMANGRRVNLAIPVLASIYEGLNIVAISLKPADTSHSFSIHFVYARPKSIKITLKRKKNEDKQVDGGENNPPHALVPRIVIECGSQAAVAEASKGKDSSHNMTDSYSSNKDRHWKRQKKELMPLKATWTNESSSGSSLVDFVAELEDEVQSIDDGEESETSHSSTMTLLRLTFSHQLRTTSTSFLSP
ncbi:UNVERIFIED_CONTAM: hypothetical protein Scaly_2567600 [Sesamum calycinum]|uniref:Aminotransferase-like plant mobile domain-containing protein n=1 Tax=Sesamum calycinum TaxID=2727403 RepID=A0AAW2K1G2_9LAMI